MALIDDIQAALHRWDAGHITTALHDEVVRLLHDAHKLIEELTHGNQHQGEPQGTTAPQAGSAAGRKDTGSEVAEGAEVEESGTP